MYAFFSFMNEKFGYEKQDKEKKKEIGGNSLPIRKRIILQIHIRLRLKITPQIPIRTSTPNTQRIHLPQEPRSRRIPHARRAKRDESREQAGENIVALRNDPPAVTLQVDDQFRFVGCETCGEEIGDDLRLYGPGERIGVVGVGEGGDGQDRGVRAGGEEVPRGVAVLMDDDRGGVAGEGGDWGDGGAWFGGGGVGGQGAG
jgi:hypothetical protein